MSQNYKFILGSHVAFSAPDFFVGSVKEALSYGANTLMVYTGAPQNTIRKPLDINNIRQAQELLKLNNVCLDNLVVHAPYIINLCSEKPETRVLAVDFLTQEIKRCEELGISLLVLHPGSKLNQPLETGIQQIIDGLNFVLDKLETKVIICLETMAGKGSEVCSKLSEIQAIFSKVHKTHNLGVCIDTCHLNDAGYKMSEFDEFITEFDATIGIDKIKVVHLNDSKNPLNAHKDRHENLGYGYVGFETLCYIAWHPKLDGIPKILETPYVVCDENKKSSYPPYSYEIKMLKEKKWFDFKQTILENNKK